MIQKASEYFQRIVGWTFHNSYLTFCIIAIVFFLSLMIFGCNTPTIETPLPGEPVIGQQATIQITNEMDVFYTVSIHTENNWQDHYVVEPGEVVTVKLALRPYKVCISREFEVEQTCVTKNVSGDDIWRIRKK